MSQPSALALAFALALLAAAPWLERGARDPHNRTVGPGKILELVGRAGPAAVSLCRCLPDREVRVTDSAGFSTDVGVFDRGSAEPRQGIVILHGNVALGRNLSTYRVLASGLAARGLVVAVLDVPGFGNSDDPFRAGRPDPGYEARMVAAVIRHLAEHENVRRGQLALLGHSRGTSLALPVGIAESEVGSIVLLAGRRRWRETLADPENHERLWRRWQTRRQFVYGTLAEGYTMEDWLADADFGYEDYAAYLGQDGHKPVLLVDGELEDEADRRYFEALYAGIAEPKRFLRLSGADHYLNAAQSLGVIAYERAVVEQLVSGLVDWLESLAVPPAAS